MPQFGMGQPVETEEPVVEVAVDPENPLPPGRHVFQLVVFDDAGNQSAPDLVEVIVRDSQAPTAVISGPAQVEWGQSFMLSGKGSSDVAPGKVVRYVWTLVPQREPSPQPSPQPTPRPQPGPRPT
jgi:hypothetical protein